MFTFCNLYSVNLYIILLSNLSILNVRVSLSLKINEPERGGGTYKMNNSVLKSKLFQRTLESFWSRIYNILSKTKSCSVLIVENPITECTVMKTLITKLVHTYVQNRALEDFKIKLEWWEQTKAKIKSLTVEVSKQLHVTDKQVKNWENTLEKLLENNTDRIHVRSKSID
jgi:1,2-phenylacetyl-CoA epoxidase catalytic subunit